MTAPGETKARGARKVEIINLGLEPWEALTMGLEIEPIEVKERRKPVADYAAEYPCEEAEGDWAEWLQTNRTKRDVDAGIYRVARRQDGPL
jgi:hypothetical protein